MDIRLLLRAKRLAQHPPSARRVWLVLGVIALCLVLAGAEYMFGGGGDPNVARPQVRIQSF